MLVRRAPWIQSAHLERDPFHLEPPSLKHLAFELQRRARVAVDFPSHPLQKNMLRKGSGPCCESRDPTPCPVACQDEGLNTMYENLKQSQPMRHDIVGQFASRRSMTYRCFKQQVPQRTYCYEPERPQRRSPLMFRSFGQLSVMYSVRTMSIRRILPTNSEGSDGFPPHPDGTSPSKCLMGGGISSGCFAALQIPAASQLPMVTSIRFTES